MLYEVITGGVQVSEIGKVIRPGFAVSRRKGREFEVGKLHLSRLVVFKGGVPHGTHTVQGDALGLGGNAEIGGEIEVGERARYSYNFV